MLSGSVFAATFERDGRRPKPELQRSASTLTEVLVAIMIASIGLVSVATLFPLSILRSVKATQLTSATDVRYNAEATIDMYPDMIQHPYSRNANFAYINPVTGATNNIAAVDPPMTLNYVIDPLGFAAIAGLNNGAGLTIGASAVLHQNRPEHWFGNDLNGGTAPPITSIPWVDTSGNNLWGMARYPMTWRTLAQAHYLVTLPDSWLLQFDMVNGPGTPVQLQTDPGAPAGTGPTQITLAGLSYPTSPPVAPPAPSPPLRVVMFSADGVTSQIRSVTAIPAVPGNTVIWTEDVNGNGVLDAGEDLNNNGVLDHYPLPASFVAAGIGIVRLEAQDPRYTWLLTVRQSSLQSPPYSASVDVVVFFNRSLENIGTDELLYPAIFGLGSTQVTVTYPTGLNTATNLPLKPFMKKGGFIFDANNAYWYKISNVVDNAPGAGFATSTITLDSPANASNTTNPNVPPLERVAMFPRNVVDVYSLGQKP